ncbi:hypothetical protein [Dactylosporangium sp. CA-233914]|uniref:hypothetical protein n=1 Tax=Dactylosporangium sp. CA-233914 TaxID=3239934 RepID=UPI003D946DD7
MSHKMPEFTLDDITIDGRTLTIHAVGDDDEMVTFTFVPHEDVLPSVLALVAAGFAQLAADQASLLERAAKR